MKRNQGFLFTAGIAVISTFFGFSGKAPAYEIHAQDPVSMLALGSYVHGLYSYPIDVHGDLKAMKPVNDKMIFVYKTSLNHPKLPQSQVLESNFTCAMYFYLSMHKSMAEDYLKDNDRIYFNPNNYMAIAEAEQTTSPSPTGISFYLKMTFAEKKPKTMMLSQDEGWMPSAFWQLLCKKDSIITYGDLQDKLGPNMKIDVSGILQM